jgi:hypothetical protein
MHRPIKVAHNSFIQGLHTTKNTASEDICPQKSKFLINSNQRGCNCKSIQILYASFITQQETSSQNLSFYTMPKCLCNVIVKTFLQFSSIFFFIIFTLLTFLDVPTVDFVLEISIDIRVIILIDGLYWLPCLLH